MYHRYRLIALIGFAAWIAPFISLIRDIGTERYLQRHGNDRYIEFPSKIFTADYLKRANGDLQWVTDGEIFVFHRNVHSVSLCVGAEITSNFRSGASYKVKVDDGEYVDGPNRSSAPLPRNQRPFKLAMFPTFIDVDIAPGLKHALPDTPDNKLHRVTVDVTYDFVNTNMVGQESTQENNKEFHFQVLYTTPSLNDDIRRYEMQRDYTETSHEFKHVHYRYLICFSGTGFVVMLIGLVAGVVHRRRRVGRPAQATFRKQCQRLLVIYWYIVMLVASSYVFDRCFVYIETQASLVAHDSAPKQTLGPKSAAWFISQLDRLLGEDRQDRDRHDKPQ